MPSSLLPCGECRRHVRVSERLCPFCGAALSFGVPLADLRWVGRLDRSRLMAFGAALSAAGLLTACQESALAPAKPPRPPSEASEPAPAASVSEPGHDAVDAPPGQPEPSVTAPAEPKVPAPQLAPSARSNPEPGAPAAAYGGPPSMPGPGSGPVAP